jgi:hypothetical protein
MKVLQQSHQARCVVCLLLQVDGKAGVLGDVVKVRSSWHAT